MRTLALIGLLVLLGSALWAEEPKTELEPGAFGTRTGSPVAVAPTSSADGSLNWLQATLALVVVAIGLRYGLPKLLGWASKTGGGSPLDGQVKVIETRAVPGGSLMLVKARDKLLLVGSTPQGMQLLADLTDTLPEPATTDTAFEQTLRHAQPYTPPTDYQRETEQQVHTRLQQTRQKLEALIGRSV
ncbi:MAG: flagellar biosynthetic protein FliO [Fimbriimonadales bacterium]